MFCNVFFRIAFMECALKRIFDNKYELNRTLNHLSYDGVKKKHPPVRHINWSLKSACSTCL